MQPPSIDFVWYFHEFSHKSVSTAIRKAFGLDASRHHRPTKNMFHELDYHVSMFHLILISWWLVPDEILSCFLVAYQFFINISSNPKYGCLSWFQRFFLNIIELETGVMTDILVLTRAADHGAQHWDFSSERVSRFSSEK